MIDRPRGVRSPSRSCVIATADAPADKPGIVRIHSAPNAPARRAPRLTGMSSTRRNAANPRSWTPIAVAASAATGRADRPVRSAASMAARWYSSDGLYANARRANVRGADDEDPWPAFDGAARRFDDG